jgi:hypothetical protein
LMPAMSIFASFLSRSQKEHLMFPVFAMAEFISG